MSATATPTASAQSCNSGCTSPGRLSFVTGLKRDIALPGRVEEALQRAAQCGSEGGTREQGGDQRLKPLSVSGKPPDEVLAGAAAQCAIQTGTVADSSIVRVAPPSTSSRARLWP